MNDQFPQPGFGHNQAGPDFMRGPMPQPYGQPNPSYHPQGYPASRQPGYPPPGPYPGQPTQPLEPRVPGQTRQQFRGQAPIPAYGQPLRSGYLQGGPAAYQPNLQQSIQQAPYVERHFGIKTPKGGWESLASFSGSPLSPASAAQFTTVRTGEQAPEGHPSGAGSADVAFGQPVWATAGQQPASQATQQTPFATQDQFGQTAQPYQSAQASQIGQPMQPQLGQQAQTMQLVPSQQPKADQIGQQLGTALQQGLLGQTQPQVQPQASGSLSISIPDLQQQLVQAAQVAIIQQLAQTAAQQIQQLQQLQQGQPLQQGLIAGQGPQILQQGQPVLSGNQTPTSQQGQVPVIAAAPTRQPAPQLNTIRPAEFEVIDDEEDYDAEYDDRSAKKSHSDSRASKKAAGTSTSSMSTIPLGLGIASLVLGGVALATSFIPIINNLSFIFGILGLILGTVATVICITKRAKGKGISIAGMIVNVIACVMVVVLQFYFASALEELFGAANPSSPNATQGSQSGDGSVNSPKLAPSVTPSQTGTDSGSSANTTNLPVGTSVETPSGLVVTLNSVQEDLTNFDDTELIGVNVTYKNNSDATISFNVYSWKGEDADGAQRDRVYYSDGTNDLGYGELAPGGTVSGNVYFENNVVKVVFDEDIFSNQASISWLL